MPSLLWKTRCAFRKTVKVIGIAALLTPFAVLGVGILSIAAAVYAVLWVGLAVLFVFYGLGIISSLLIKDLRSHLNKEK